MHGLCRWSERYKLTEVDKSEDGVKLTNLDQMNIKDYVCIEGLMSLVIGSLGPSKMDVLP